MFYTTARTNLHPLLPINLNWILYCARTVRALKGKKKERKIDSQCIDRVFGWFVRQTGPNRAEPGRTWEENFFEWADERGRTGPNGAKPRLDQILVVRTTVRPY